VVIELWAVEAFCLIACLFFVASVLSMLEMQVSLSLFEAIYSASGHTGCGKLTSFFELSGLKEKGS
jgi:hypothetical protein